MTKEPSFNVWESNRLPGPGIVTRSLADLPVESAALRPASMIAKTSANPPRRIAPNRQPILQHDDSYVANICLVSYKMRLKLPIEQPKSRPGAGRFAPLQAHTSTGKCKGGRHWQNWQPDVEEVFPLYLF
jgi:hypothetical protein